MDGPPELTWRQVPQADTSRIRRSRPRISPLRLTAENFEPHPFEWGEVQIFASQRQGDTNRHSRNVKRGFRKEPDRSTDPLHACGVLNSVGTESSRSLPFAMRLIICAPIPD